MASGDGFDVYIANDASGITGAAGRIRDFDVRNSELALWRRQLRGNGPQRQVVDHRRFARHAVVVHGIGTIGANLHLEDGVLALAGDALDGNPDRSEVLRQADGCPPWDRRTRAAMLEKVSFLLLALGSQLSASSALLWADG